MTVERVIMPKLGAYTEDVLLTEWRVAEGARVAAGTVVFELETDKTTAEVEAESSGWLHRLVAAGESVPIGAVVALIAGSEEEYEQLAAGGASAATGARSPAVAAAAAAAAPPAAPAPLAAAPRRHPDGPAVSPRARALLQSLGFTVEDAREIRGSGPGGRILDRDVAAWAEARGAPPGTAAAAGTVTVTEPAVAERIPLRGRRGTIARRMVSSLQTAAQLTSVLELDVTPLVELRRRLNEGGATPPVGVTAIVVQLVAAALRQHPRLNARVTETEIEVLADVNVAVAVETPDGLIAPVVHAADRLSLGEINARVAELAARARDGSLTPADVAGGTFTVSNGGVHHVDLTTAILNPPQCAILWIGRIRDRAVVVGDGIVAARPTLQACLTFDHRAIDGGPAAAFLTTLERLVAGLRERPA
jgi:pyruvate dehydrogenase E2 component (dihydrolipoamide acetyltransferase)